MSVGVPIKLMHEGLGHTVTVEVKSGETYRGQLVGAICKHTILFYRDTISVSYCISSSSSKGVSIGVPLMSH